MQGLDFNPQEVENFNGVRFTWNTFPQTRATEDKLSIPITALYTPNRQMEHQEIRLPYRPLICAQQGCLAALNPYCNVNYHQRTWHCALCGHRNQFPQEYAQMSEVNPPAELSHNLQTIEYSISDKPSSPIFLFCVDIATLGPELDAVKIALRMAFREVQDDAMVGLITFGANIHVYDLSSKFLPKSYTFPGTKPTTIEQLSQRLGLSFSNVVQGKSLSANANPNVAAAANNNNSLQQLQQPQQFQRFLAPVMDCEEMFHRILDSLQPDPWVYSSKTRPSRCTGLAMALGLNLLEFTHHNDNARLMMFVAGASVTATPEELIKKDPVQLGKDGKPLDPKIAEAQAAEAAAKLKQPNLGEVATNSFADPMRSHHDIHKGEAPLYLAAANYYSQMAQKAVKSRHIVDLFAGCLDQVGLAEMYPVVTQTGGELVLDDSFTRGVFQGSMKRIFKKQPYYNLRGEETGSEMLMSFGAQLHVLTSSHLVVNGGLGHCTNMNVPGRTTNTKNPIGAGNTQQWYLGGLMHDTTFAVYLSVNENAKPTAKPSGPAAGPGGGYPSSPQSQLQQAFIQFQTIYKDSRGGTWMRVTTCGRTISDEFNALRQSFDEQCAVVAMTRLALHKLAQDPQQDIRRWLDRQLIKLCVKFVKYQHKNPTSFELPSNLQLYPIQMYYLRRSPLINIKNSSPDETVLFRTVASKQNTENTLTIIQPTLVAYSLQTPGEHGDYAGVPVSLDSSQLSPQRILVLDTFFNIVIWYGTNIAAWKSNKIWEKDEQYAYIKQLCVRPLLDAKFCIASRCPTPRFIECVEGGSQARFMLAKLNPSTAAAVGVEGDVINFTEDITLNTFLQHLKRLVVENPQEPF